MFLLQFVAVVAATRSLPTMGWSTWCTNGNSSTPFSWLPCYDDMCSEAEVMSVAKSMVQSGLAALGYRMILLDDCWADTKRAPGTNEIQADRSRFPSGTLAVLASYLHSMGLQLGAYTDVGPTTCRGGRMGSWPFYQQDAHTFASWGLDMVKMDWCHHPGGFTQQQLYTNFSMALNATGKHFNFNICGWGLNDVWTWGGKIATSYRVGPDHIPLIWTPNTNQDPGHGQGLLNIIETQRGLSQFEGVADPDFLEPGYVWNGPELDRVEMSFWCMWAAPLMVATDVRDLSNKQALLNKEAIAINQDPLMIPGDAVSPVGDHAQIWTRELSGGRWAALLFNSDIFSFTDRTPLLRFDSSMLKNWPSGKSASVRDVWTHKNLGVYVGSFNKTLAAREMIMVVLTPM